jgi:RNA polymerase sigma factor (sigma-70 family)
VLQDLRRFALRHDGDERTSSQLLETFLRSRDPLALEALVRRHAPMVWGVCRRTLANDHEAEDAFQATFLVLLRRAASLRTPELLSHWLSRVAYKTACKARQRAVKRSSREKQVKVLPEPPPEPPGDTFGLDLREVLHEELNRLPEKYRSAVVLCDLEEKTRQEAARQLSLPEGTVASRLAKGRALLARRLLRRGLGVSATGVVAAGAQQVASAAVPAALLANTVKAVGLLAAGNAAAAGLVSAEVSPLADSVLHAMTVAKRKTIGVVLVLAALVLAGGMITYHALAARPDQPPPAPEVPPPGNPLPVAEKPGEVRRFPVEEAAWSVAFSPDSQLVLIGTGGGGTSARSLPVRVYAVSSGQEVLRTRGGYRCWSVAYSPDGKSIAVGPRTEPIQILDARTGQVRRELVRPGAFPGMVHSVTFSPDSRLLAASHADGQLHLWDVARGQMLQHKFRVDTDAYRSAAFTPDGKLVLVIDPNMVLRLYEVGSGKEVRQFVGNTARVTEVAISPDGKRALSCSWDASLRLWDLQTGKVLRRLMVPDPCPNSVAFCPDSRRALSGSNNALLLWDLETGQQLHRFEGAGSIESVAVSPNGQYALSGSSGTVQLWRLPKPAR